MWSPARSAARGCSKGRRLHQCRDNVWQTNALYPQIGQGHDLFSRKCRATAFTIYGGVSALYQLHVIAPVQRSP